MVPVAGYRHVSGYTEVIRSVDYRSIPHTVSIVIQIELVCRRPEYSDLRYSIGVPVSGYRNVSGYTEVIRSVDSRSIPRTVPIVIQG